MKRTLLFLALTAMAPQLSLAKADRDAIERPIARPIDRCQKAIAATLPGDQDDWEGFKQVLNADPDLDLMKQTDPDQNLSPEDKVSAVYRNRYLLRYAILRTLAHPYLTAAPPRSRVLFVIRALKAFASYVKENDQLPIEKDREDAKAWESFFRQVIAGNPEFTADDLNRLDQGWLEFKASLTAKYAYPISQEFTGRECSWPFRATDPTVYAGIDCLILEKTVERASVLDNSEQWTDRLKYLTNAEGLLLIPGSLPVMAEKSLRLLPTGADKNASALTMEAWLKSLSSIQPICWQEVLKTFKVFKSYAAQQNYSERDFKRIRKVMKSLARAWPVENQKAGQPEIDAPLSAPKALPQ